MEIIVLNSGREKTLKEIKAREVELNVAIVISTGEQTSLGSRV